VPAQRWSNPLERRIERLRLLYHGGGKGRPRAQRILTDTDPTQQRLADLFGIQRYSPTR